jgi:hypothetical protein
VNWSDRLANYKRELPYPVHMAAGPDGYLFGIWRMGNNYKVKSGYYGGYPATYLARIKALFPDKKRVLHLFSGHVDLALIPGDTVDLDPLAEPTYLDDAQSLEAVPLEEYDLVLADPPYSVEDAEHYAPTMIKRNKVFKALGARLTDGCHVVWLDQTLPIYRKDLFVAEGAIGVVRSTNHRFRVVSFFRKFDAAEGL